MRGSSELVQQRRWGQWKEIARLHLEEGRGYLTPREVRAIVTKSRGEILIVMNGLYAHTGVNAYWCNSRKVWVFGDKITEETYSLTEEQKEIRHKILIRLGT